MANARESIPNELVIPNEGENENIAVVPNDKGSSADVTPTTIMTQSNSSDDYSKPALHDDNGNTCQDGNDLDGNEEYRIKKNLSEIIDETDAEGTRRHMTSTIALCVCVLAHSYLLVSVFPYSGFMAIELIPDVNEENAGSYAGLIASSFMIGRAFSSFTWGKIADIYGRKPVLNASLVLSAVFTLLFGMSPTFSIAMAMRFCLGLSNGIVGTAKTAVSELARGNEMLETRGMGLVIGMWGWGFLISPALSGALAEPVRQYPLNPLVEEFEPFLSRFPFLLPNLVGAMICFLAIAGVVTAVEETLPEKKRRSPVLICSDLCSWLLGVRNKIFHSRQVSVSVNETTPLRSSETSSSFLQQYTNGHKIGEQDEENGIKEIQMRHNESCSILSAQMSFSPRSSLESARRLSSTCPDTIQLDRQLSVRSDASEARATMSSLWSRKSTRDHLLTYWVYSFVVICVDEAFPLFCISKEAGLGLSEASIGKVLSGSGLVFVVCQYFVFATITNRFGLYPSIIIGSIFCTPIVIFIPLSIALNRNASNGEMNLPTYIFLASIMAVYRIFGSVYFSGITIATNRTVPSSQRATMNGLSMLGGSFAKGFGPAFAGFLVAFSVSSGVFSPHVGSVVVFLVIGFLGLMVTISSFVLLKEGDGKREGESSMKEVEIHDRKLDRYKSN